MKKTNEYGIDTRVIKEGSIVKAIDHNHGLALGEITIVKNKKKQLGTWHGPCLCTESPFFIPLKLLTVEKIISI